MVLSPEVHEWFQKADGDADGAELLVKSYRPTLGHLIVFHCQQAAEKYLKGLLISRGVAFPKTHGLKLLLALGNPPLEVVARLEPALNFLQPFAVDVRYPGFDPSEAVVREAVMRMRAVQSYCRGEIGLTGPVPPG
jgi:HEPN domain-containing protein